MVKAIPDGYSTVCPWIISTDTGRVIDFMVEAFGAEEIAHVEFDGAIGHAEVRLGDSMVLLFDSRPTWPATPAFLRLYLENASEAFDRAVQAGAVPITAMTEMYWGDVVGRVRDPLGNVWWIQEHIEDVDPEDLERRAAEPRFVDAMTYVTGADPFGAAD